MAGNATRDSATRSMSGSRSRQRIRELEQRLKRLDTSLIQLWNRLKTTYPSLPLPPSVTDLMVDHYLRVDLDGGQAKYESPSVPANRVFQYRFSCKMMTEGLRHDSARAEFIFKDDRDQELAVHATTPMRGTHGWTTVTLDLVRPPLGATQMAVRLLVDRSEDGLEDIRGAVGFDDVRIDQYPQLQITTDDPLGIYKLGERIEVKAKIMGLPVRESKVQLRLFDTADQEVVAKLLTVNSQAGDHWVDQAAVAGMVDSEVVWTLPPQEAGFYRLDASIVGRSADTLSTTTTFAVIDKSLGGSPHGSFGWTLPSGSEGILPRDLASWLADLGVAWVKYPCWLDPNDTVAAEETAALLTKLQDVGIEIVGMLDYPPEDQVAKYALQGRRNLVAAQLFRDLPTWQPLLEPVMTRLTLKVRTWQLGADRDDSFLGRPRLRESIQQIATGLQGFGQPIDVAISWPWLERELPAGEASWQATCRSSDPPLTAKELDAYLSLRDNEPSGQGPSGQGPSGQGPRTWLLLDPVAKGQYDRETRIRDLVLRMATVRSHRVQAAFVSNPRDPQHGLLRPDGRPDELLLPWRTTSRLIGNLRHDGALQLRSGAENLVFVGPDRAVLMLWAPQPTEELMYLGDHVQTIDVWGKVTDLPNEVMGNQFVQRIPIGPLPTFVVGVDPALLKFRMSVELSPKHLDSFLGEMQRLNISFDNPTQESLVGRFLVRAPETWTIDHPGQAWEMLAGRATMQHVNVVLGNTSKIGQYELPIQFTVETTPPQVITVYKKVTVGPEGLDLDVTTRLTSNGDLRVQIEMTNHAADVQSYDCMLFPSADLQYQRCFVTILPGQTVRREIYWRNGAELVGKRMLLRADEEDGPRVFNHSFEVNR